MSRLDGRVFVCAVLVTALAVWAAPLFADGAGTPKFKESWSSVQGVRLRLGPGEGAGEFDRPGANADAISVSSGFLWKQINVNGRSPEPKKPHQVIPVTGAIADLAVADFNGDGIQDLAALDFVWGRVEIYLASRDGRLAHHATVPVGTAPIRLAAGDFDGDGHADIAAANLENMSITRASGMGNGHFRPARTEKADAKLFAFAMARAAAGVDYTALKNAVNTMDMLSSTRKKLKSSVTQSEKAYQQGNRRKAIARLEKFIRNAIRIRDKVLSEANRESLIAMAQALIDQILAGGNVTATITANPASIDAGGTSTLTWTTTGAATATINGADVALNGSMGVTPAVTTLYTLMARAADGETVTASATVTVGGGAGMIYVNVNTGSDTTGDGSLNKPYRSITKGLSVAASGNTVNVAGGLYDVDAETFPLTIPDGVTVQGAGSASTLIIANAAYPNAAVVMGNNTVLNGVKVQNGVGFGIWVENTSTISNTAVVGCSADGIEAIGAANLTLTNSQVTGMAWDGVWFSDTAQGTVTGCTLSNNAYRGYTAYNTPGPIVVNSNTLTDNGGGSTGYSALSSQIYITSTSNNTISGNTIGLTPAVYYQINNVFANNATSSNVISGNTIVGTYAFGYYWAYAVHVRGTSTCNISGNNISQAYRAVRLQDAGANPTVSGNTLVGNDTGVRGSSGSGVFRNNTISGNYDSGVRISGTSNPDFGTAGSHGGNVFHNLATGCANFWNATAGALNAVGNTWDNAPPTVVNGTTCGYDIQQNPGTVNY